MTIPGSTPACWLIKSPIDLTGIFSISPPLTLITVPAISGCTNGRSASTSTASPVTASTLVTKFTVVVKSINTRTSNSIAV